MAQKQLRKVQLVETQSFPKQIVEAQARSRFLVPIEEPHRDKKRFILQEDGVTVGGVSITKGNKNYGSIEDFIILDEMRGSGLGCAAFIATQEHASSVGCRVLEGIVLEENKAMALLTERTGWIRDMELVAPNGERAHKYFKVNGGFENRANGRASQRWRQWKPVSRYSIVRNTDRPQKGIASEIGEDVEETLFLLPTLKDAQKSTSGARMEYGNIAELHLLLDIDPTVIEACAEVINDPEKTQNYIRQRNFDFRDREIGKALRALLRIPVDRIPETKLVVFAGYTGQFSQALKRIGFDVTHTDLCAQYVRKDMPSFELPSHLIPNMGYHAYISFEGFPALMFEHGFLTMMKALAETPKGMIMATHHRSILNPSYKQFTAFSEAYGLGVEDVLTSNLLLTRIFANEKSREKIVFDFKVLLVLEDHRPSYAMKFSAGALGLLACAYGTEQQGEIVLTPDLTRRISRKEISEITARIGISEKEFMRSIRRMQCAWMLGEPYNL